MIIRSYKKNIVEGRGFIVFSIILAIIVRVVYFIYTNDSSVNGVNPGVGYLWKPISDLFNNPFISFLSSSVCVILILMMLMHINTKYVLIRRKTSLHLAIGALLFSAHPDLIFMNANYISILFVLAAISQMFSSYATHRKAKSSLEVSFLLAMGSLFSPSLLFFLPIFWIALGIVRSFDFKGFLASLFSVACVYIPVFSYYLFIGRVQDFLLPLKTVSTGLFNSPPIANFGQLGWGLFGFITILFGIIFVHNYMTNYKDKIRVRALVSSLYLLGIFSLPALSLVTMDATNSLYILLASGTLILTHFFALAEEKWIIYLFYLSTIVYLIFVSLTFAGII